MSRAKQVKLTLIVCSCLIIAIPFIHFSKVVNYRLTELQRALDADYKDGDFDSISYRSSALDEYRKHIESAGKIESVQLDLRASQVFGVPNHLRYLVRRKNGVFLETWRSNSYPEIALDGFHAEEQYE
ncbi:MAG: hypothetical protein KDC26_05490 [Armatimonadetes bacterium]|nr:hypothetical protein [Armatimonadota bacterium]